MSITSAEALAITGRPVLAPVLAPVAASMSRPVPLGDELSDDDLEHVVGGLARMRPVDLGLASGPLDA
ncbi:MAG: hypothetical protein JO180_02810 [Gemmatirosa sp.]|nr:hypothetical protein [Gemmatirosa sp.]